MALVIPDDCSNWIVTITNSGGGASAKSTISLGTANSGILDQTKVDRISNLFRDGLKPFWDSGWSVGPVHVIESQGGPPYNVWDNTTTEAGTNGAAVYASPAVSIIVTKQTGIGGKAYRGRMYLPGIQESNVDEAGTIDSGAVSAYQTLIDALKTNLLADAAINDLTLFHDEESPAAGTDTVISNLLVRSVVGTMRPRQRR